MEVNCINTHPHSIVRRGGRAAEGSCLLSSCRDKTLPGVRIPPSPPVRHFARAGFLFLLMKRVFFCGVASKARSGGAGFLSWGFAQRMFELSPKNTAKLDILKNRGWVPRRKAPRHLFINTRSHIHSTLTLSFSFLNSFTSNAVNTVNVVKQSISFHPLSKVKV